jgi:riboflavin synthase
MFTGIITNIGVVKNLSYLANQDLLIALELPHQIDRSLEIGCSIACNGVCLTLVKKIASNNSLIVGLEFQASSETLSKTNINHCKIGNKINLEFALRMGDELGGHLVAGHVDDVAKILEIQPINNDSWRFTIDLPQNLRKFIATKGSVVLNGVSLTVNEVFADTFSVNIIKHTFDNTNFSNLKIGDYLNLEVDLIARYLEKLITK